MRRRTPIQRARISVVSAFAALSVAAAAVAFAGAPPAATADSSRERPTFYRDVLPILQAHCQDCHRAVGNSNSGMVAPMALVAFDEVRPWAKAIAKVTAAREMPPWFPAPEFHGRFVEERGLSEPEIETLARWEHPRHGTLGARTPPQSKAGSTTRQRGTWDALSTGSASQSLPGSAPQSAGCHLSSPSIAAAQGSTSSFAGLKRWPSPGW